MDTFEFNKIAGAMLGTVLIVLALQNVADILYAPEHPETLAYSLEVEGEDHGDTGGEETEETVISMAEMMQGASAEEGESQTRKCAACHTFDSGGANGVGPNLYGVMGRAPGTVAGYGYSDALLARATEIGTWDFETLNDFLSDPKGYVEGTKMAFNGISRINQRADLLMYLNQLSDNPIPMPVEEASETQGDDASMAEDGAAMENGDDSMEGDGAAMENGDDSMDGGDGTTDDGDGTQ